MAESSSSSSEGAALVDTVEFPEFVVEEALSSRPKFSTFQPATSSSRGAFSSIRGFIGFGSQVQDLAIPKAVIARLDEASPIHTSISPQLDTLVAIHTSGIQIRSVKDKFKTVKASWTFPGDSFPVSSWRSCSWHPSGKFFAVTNFSEIFILRSNATLLFRVSSVFLGFDDGIAESILRAWDDDSRSELLVLGFNKILVRLQFSSDGSGKVSSTAEFFQDVASKSALRLEPYLHSVSSLSLSPDGKTIIVGGSLELSGPRDPRGTSPICAFALLDGPGDYYKRLHPGSPIAKPAPVKGFFGFSRNVKPQEGPIVEVIRLSPNGSHFVVLDTAPSLALWDATTLTQKVVWSAESLSRFFGNSGRISISDINWWDNNSVALFESGGKLRILHNIVSNRGVAPLFPESIPTFRGASSVTQIEVENILIVETFTKEVRVPENFKFSTQDTSAFKLYLNDAATYVGLDLDPTPIGPKFISKQFRFTKLTAIRASTPERLFHSKVENGVRNDFEFALRLAQEHGLSTDFVFQKQFASHPVTEASIQRSLARVKDLKWLLEECKQRVPQTKEGLEALLAFGILTAEKAKPSDPLEAALVALHRHLFVQFRERLSIYLRLVKGSYRAEEFLEFRSRDLANVCVALIENGEVERAKDLFQVEEVGSRRLDILAQVSSTINPIEYEALLPTATSSSSDSAPSSSKAPIEVKEALRKAGLDLPFPSDIRGLLNAFALLTFEKVHGRKSASLEEAFASTLSSTRHFDSKDVYARPFEVPEKSLFDPTPSLQQSNVIDWYLTRAKQIEDSSGLLHNAIALIEAGIRKCGQDERLANRLNDFKGYHVVIYNLGKLDLPFADFSKLSPQQRFALYLSKSTPDTVTMHLRTIVLPLVPKDKFQGLLAVWLQEQAREGLLDLCFTVFDESHFPNADANILSPQRQLLSVAIDCLYSCEAASPQTWKAMGALLSVLPSPPSNDSSGEEEVDVLEERLKVMKILSNYGVNKPLYLLRDKWTQDHVEEVTDLISRLCQSGVRARPQWKPTQWQKLLSDVQLIVETCFDFLGPNFAKFQYFKTLLKANQFGLARDFVREEGPQLSGVDALVFDAAREHFNSCIVLDEEALNLMMEILKLIPKTTSELKAELELIEATKRIQRLSASILPAQIRLAKNKIDIISAILEANHEAYRTQSELVEIYALLGQKAPSNKLEVLGLIAQKAYDLKDFITANDLCIELLTHGGNKTHLKLALSLARNERNSDLAKRAQFISFALLHCEAAEISELLKLREGILIRLDLTKMKLAPSTADKLSSPSVDLLKELSTQLPAPISLQSVDRFPRLNFFDSNPKSSFGAKSATVALPPQYRLLFTKIGEVLELLPQSEKDRAFRPDLLALRDRVLLALSLQSLRQDVASYISYLSEDKAVLAHFKEETSAKEVKHCEIATTLACYFYALKFLDSISRIELVRKKLTNLPEWSALPKFSPSSLVGLVVASFFESNGDLQSLMQVLPSDHPSLTYLKRCRQFYLKLNDFVAVKELSELSNQIDIARFGSDEPYRTSVILEQCHSMKEGALEKALKLSAKYRVPKFEMLTEFVRWALIEGYKSFLKDASGNSVNRTTAVNESVAALESAIAPHIKELISITPIPSTQGPGPSASVFLGRLKNILAEVNGLHYEALHFLFSLMRRCLPSNATQEIWRSDLFLQILPRLKKVSFLHRVDFKRILLGPSEAREEISAQIDPQNVSVYAKLLPTLVPLWKQIPNPTFSVTDLDKVTESSVFYLLVKSLVFGSADPDEAIKSDSFENRSASEWATLLEVVRPYFEKLDPLDLGGLASSLTVAPPAHKVAIDIRIKIMGEIVASSKASNEKLVAIKNHLSFLSLAEKSLINLEGLNVDEALLALDLAFDNKDKAIDLIVGLVLNGLPPLDALALFDKLRPLGPQQPSLTDFTLVTLKLLFTTLLSQIYSFESSDITFAQALEAAKKSSAIVNRTLTTATLSPPLAFLALTSLLANLSLSIGKSPNKTTDIDLLAKALMAEVFKVTESPSFPQKDAPSLLTLIEFLVAHSNLYFDQQSLFQTHSKIVAALRSKSVIGEIASQLGATEAEMESVEGREKIFETLLGQVAFNLANAPSLEKLASILLHWTSEPSAKGANGISPYHSLWARLITAMVEKRQIEDVVALLKRTRSFSIHVLTDEDSTALETLASSLTPAARFSLGILLSDKTRASSLASYIKHITGKKDLIFGEDFDERVLALIIEEGLVGKLAPAKLAPLLCDFVLIALDRSSSSGSTPDLLNLPLLISPRVLVAYERIHTSWKSRPFDHYLHFAVTCAQFLEVKHLPWLSHLILAYRRIPMAKSSIEDAVALLGPFCEELRAHCDQIGLQLGTEASEEDNPKVMAAIVDRCQKFTVAAKNLAKGFGL